MRQDSSDPSLYIRQTTFGTLVDVLAGGLSLPTGIITAGFLTRSLGPEDYGLLSTVVVIIVWVEIAVSVGFNRSLIHFVNEKARWPKIGSVLQMQLLVSLIAAGLLAAFSGMVARALHSSELTIYLCLFCLDIPLFTLGVNHKSILVAQGRYLQRAVLTAVFWLSRMALIVLFVTLEPTVSFAILAFIGASLIVLTLARLMVRPPLFPIRIVFFSSLWHFAWPLFIFTVGITTFRNIDLVLVKAFDPSGLSTGFYAAAKNLTLILGLYTASFSPLLQSKLAELAAAGRKKAAQALLGNSLRLTICMLPLAGLASGSSLEVVRLIYGSDFSRAAPLLAVLMFGAVFLSILSVAVAALIAAKRPNLPLLLTGPVILSAPALYPLAISRFGPLGAAWLATGLAFVALVPVLGASLRLWGIGWPATTLLKSGLICVFAYGMATYWVTSGILVLFKLAVGSLGILLFFYCLGELKRYEMARFLSALFPGKGFLN